MASKRKINTKGLPSEDKLFHNEWIKVYITKLPFERIYHWPENLRTILDFELLKIEKKEEIKNIPTDDITEFLLSRYDLKIDELSESISRNGVRVPLIILDSGKLLDGNRRYFACNYLKMQAIEMKAEIPQVLKEIPVWVIRKNEITKIQEQKILAEANFVKDFKIPWTLDVKAKVINKFYSECIAGKMSHENAIEEIKNVYGLSKQDISAYLETIMLTKEYIATAPAKKKLERKERVQKKFVYFWEFRNKALRGRGALDAKKELPKVKQLFFKMIDTERFNNIKQVEPMIRSIRDEHSWNMLNNSNGVKIAIIEALYLEKKVVKSNEDKVRNFSVWLEEMATSETFSNATYKLLDNLLSIIKDTLTGKK